ncbi:histidine kinase [Arcobacter suis]|uniref:PAS sensor-containing signal transduction protein n=1 Tax=Arcobacter suis CECT 7833 TaxID=663365 RepID=A0AAD0SQF5_9BACT|nr:PAS domain S-box protein [Arcobacter suis]AXX89043.1 PAS sensor-containing signal transduction protein [Arcobacter suis CECT 7833]RWS47952.1 histidine kinase [Arcobacter suis]
MNDKSLGVRYFFYFLTSLFVLIFIINIFKEDEIQYSLENYKKFVHKEYLKYSNEYKNSSELIYFNEFVKNKQLIKTFKNINNTNLNEAKKEIYNHLKDSYLFYKTLDVNDISFYSSSNKLLLSMQENFVDDSSKIVAEVILNKKELSSFKIVDDNYFLIFSKPIFDENLNFLGVINIEFNFATLIKKLEYNNEFSFSMIISNQIKLNKSFYFNLTDSQKSLLIDNINKSKDFSLITKNHAIDFPVVFIPVLKSLTNENSLYLVAFNSNKNSNIGKIEKYFDVLFVIVTFLIFIIFYFSFKVKYFKTQKLIIDKKYQELHTQIDDNVIKVETDLEGIITYASKPFCKISGYSHKELLGRNVNLLKHSNISSVFFEKLWNELQTNKIWEGEIKNQDRYGNSYWIKGVIFPKYDYENKVIGYISIRSNITDTKQLEKINKLLKEDLSNKLNEIRMKDKTLVDSTKVQLMSKIIDSLGHQWKQPILNISSLIYNLKVIIKNEENSKDKLELIQQTEFELKNLSEVLNEIKYLFQQNQKKKSNLTDVIKESILATQEELQANNIKIKYDLESEISTIISFNELKNIIFNMIKNCIEQKKLNNQDEVSMIINVIKEDDLLIKIEDNLKGENKKIDENRHSNSYLYLVKLFVEKNKGLFWFENTNYNTTYYIKLKSENI